MARLIDDSDVYALFETSGFARLHVSDIDTIPRVDAVEVVRCRDCKHKGWIPGPIHGEPAHYCGVWERNPGNINTTFCSYGERRTDG